MNQNNCPKHHLGGGPCYCGQYQRLSKDPRIVIITNVSSGINYPMVKALMNHYGCKHLVHDWEGDTFLQPQTLATTAEAVLIVPPGARLIHIDQAKLAIMATQD